ncbi:hypothetical protein HR45_08815 [Shewanella mangrovi]|uniref:TonB C-terminal domain-containing protein n=1 Tax=Shewanella mangrovi TaxID=1515746 RepID=A0A094LRX0_9GAMM|nr:hypothetical protein HR45_08815 [Shewanella mangrovi]
MLSRANFCKPALAALLLSCSYSSLTLAAEQSFSDAYHAYQTALTKGNKYSIERAAKSAFELGKSEYPHDSLNYAALMMNWAKAIADISPRGMLDPQARLQAYQLYKDVQAIYQQHYDKHAPEMALVLMGLATTTDDQYKARSYCQQALEIADDAKDPLHLASIQLQAFFVLAGLHSFSRHDQHLAITAYETRAKLLPANSIDRVEAEFIAANVHLAREEFADAEPMLQDVIAQLSVLPYSHPYSLAAHLSLVKLYQQQGKPELATAHCEAIGKMRPWDENQQPEPLYRIPPRYPKAAAHARRQGSVVLSFTIDKQGYVTQPKVVESKGYQDLNNAAIESLKHWRYAPKFENGKAVSATAKVSLDFKLSKS